MVEFSAAVTTPGPGVRAGEDTRAILAELGYDPAAIAALKERGVVAWPE
jgi:crotonobetainyl-CoA:carnitine CoA-transferase CaiB-like acyl-CoA transferase